eukprot:TRINITY_DN18223_c0_g1_i4.p1 TRINITY_DN18223_c0_g1~~TRINITY_DN18223_c0_g1_i4.p1  ORF type:complete len:193 (-),score=26.77 TRINITY_DN18223_c0_g1_i4:81-659(-)
MLRNKTSSDLKQIRLPGSLTKDVWLQKMGFEDVADAGVYALWTELAPLLEKSEIDFTLFWRQLADIAELQDTDEALVAPLADAFYKPPEPAILEAWKTWLTSWKQKLVGASDAADVGQAVAARLRRVNPKYIPREWMLVEAYEAASKWDYSILKDLQRLFEKPYDEQPEFHGKYYRRAPDASLLKGGCAYMS